MNLRIVATVVAVVGLAQVSGWAQGEAQAISVIQRAKGVVNKVDAREGTAPQYPGVGGAPVAPANPPAVVAPAAPVLTPAQQSLLQLNTSLAADKDGKPDQESALEGALSANVRGVKPSGQAMNKLAADLSAAMAGKTITAAHRGRISQDIVAVLNDTTMPATQMADVVGDVPSVLKRDGVDAKAAAAVGDDLKAISAQVRK